MEQQKFNITSLSPFLQDKVNSWIESFFIECNIFENANNWSEFWRDYKEEPLLNLLITGLARNDFSLDVSILREYPVFNQDGQQGKCDLFLNYYKENCHFYFEAKYEKATWETGVVEWTEEKAIPFWKEIEDQLVPYMSVDRNINTKTYGVLFLFHLVDFVNYSDFENYLERAKQYKLPENSFYGFISSLNPKEKAYKKNFGLLEVVGKIEDFNEFKILSIDNI